MKCTRCSNDYQEKDIDESHDVPCYLFYKEVGRNNKKNKADQYPRRWLCKRCHEQYEEGLHLTLIIQALKYSKEYFKDGNS